MNPTPELIFVLLSFAVYRLALLVASDTISASLPRSVGRLGARQYRWTWVSRIITFFYELIICQYCLGVWFAAAAAYCFCQTFAGYNWFVVWWALAGAQAFLQTVGGYIRNE